MICKSYSYFFSNNTCELDIVLTRTVNILTTNEFVKANNALNNWALIVNERVNSVHPDKTIQVDLGLPWMPVQ